MTDIFSKKALIAPALIVAALALSLNPSSKTPDAVSSTLQVDASQVIVMAGNAPPPPPPRITYKMAKRLGYLD